MDASFLAVVVWLFAGGGDNPRDLASVLDPEDYFRSRQIEVKVADLLKVAEADPKTPKAQFAQLLALRWLGEHADAVKKDAGARAVLQQIAAGNKSQDAIGFAREYAQEALARIEGKAAPRPSPLPENSLRDALQWFPANASFVAALDLRPSGEVKGLKVRPILSLILKSLRPREREEMYKFAEGVGNIRIDRISMAYRFDPVNRKQNKIYLRYSGLADRKNLAEFIKNNPGDAQLEYRNGAKGEIIMVVSSKKRPPAFALIGDTDLIMAGYDGQQEGSSEVVDEVLNVRAGKEPSVVQGPFADRLKKVPALAAALAVGDLPEPLRRDLDGPGSLIKAAPRSINAHITRDKSVNIHFEAGMDSTDEAKAFVEGVEQLKKMASAGLKAMPPQIKIKPAALETLTSTIDAVKAEAKDSTVSGGVAVPGEAFTAAQDLIEQAIQFSQGQKMKVSPPAPAPPPAAPAPSPLR